MYHLKNKQTNPLLLVYLDNFTVAYLKICFVGWRYGHLILYPSSTLLLSNTYKLYIYFHIAKVNNPILWLLRSLSCYIFGLILKKKTLKTNHHCLYLRMQIVSTTGPSKMLWFRFFSSFVTPVPLRERGQRKTPYLIVSIHWNHTTLFASNVAFNLRIQLVNPELFDLYIFWEKK